MLKTAILAGLILAIVCKPFIEKHEYEPPVKWRAIAPKMSPTIYTVGIIATMKPGWGVFALRTKEGLPTTIIFEPNKDIQLVDSLEELGRACYSASFGISFPPSPKPEKYKIRTFFEDSVMFAHNFIFKGTAKSTILKVIVQWQGFNQDTVLPPNTEFLNIPIQRE